MVCGHVGTNMLDANESGAYDDLATWKDSRHVLEEGMEEMECPSGIGCGAG